MNTTDAKKALVNCCWRSSSTLTSHSSSLCLSWASWIGSLIPRSESINARRKCPDTHYTWHVYYSVSPEPPERGREGGREEKREGWGGIIPGGERLNKCQILTRQPMKSNSQCKYLMWMLLMKFFRIIASDSEKTESGTQIKFPFRKSDLTS